MPKPSLLPTPADASFAEPIAMLYACHDKVRRFCNDLNALPDYVAEHGVNAVVQEAVHRIRHYFAVAAPLHHQDEEIDFFPLLQQYVPESAATIQQLTAQHQTMHQVWQQLNEVLAKLSEAQVTADLNIIPSFVAAYTEHMRLEETLFELGKASLPTPLLQQIGLRMARRRGQKV